MMEEEISADISESNQKLICVEFPGIVKNEDRATERLGGKSALSQAHFEGHKLEVRYRPEDQYCKPAVSKAAACSYLLLKVKKHRTKSEPPVSRPESTSASSVEVEPDRSETRYSAELIGVCNKTYEFAGMADYQALPPGLNAIAYNGRPVHPNDFQMKEPLDSDFCFRDIPSFLPPGCFSKSDRPISYGFRSQLKPPKSEDTIAAPPAASRATRSKKSHLAYCLSFESAGVPQAPNPDAVESINPNNPLIPAIQQMFEERPIWSRAAIQWRVKATKLRIRNVIPLIAYNFSNGPFKRMWVKFGYDPRTDPVSKVYQCLDVRVPKDVDVVETQSHAEAESLDNVEEVAFTFFPDKLPNQRVLWYQLCDICDPECQQLIHSNDGKESIFSDSDGWCENGTYENLRKVMVTRMRAVMQSRQVTDDKT